MRAAVVAVLVAAASLIAVPVQAAEPSVALVVGLHPGATLDIDLDLRSREALPGAVAVQVPAGDVAGTTEALRDDPAVAYVEPDHTAYADVITPDDPELATQWGLSRTRVTTAWQTSRGSSSVTVAVVDTGVTAIPDLKPRLLPGYDFVNKDTNAEDDNGHGTQAAGVIGATADNGIGIAGICWYCKILPVKVLDARGSGSYTDIALGIRYAADKGADIINLSLGGPADSELLADAVDHAVAKGALVLAAAGNSGSSALHYPAAVPSVLAVGASTQGDARYPWSNFGSSWVDLAAPGCNPAQSINGLVGQYCGTSSATPFAAGVAALLAGTTPAPSAAAIRSALTTSAYGLAGNWVDAGSGRVDAAAALASLKSVAADAAVPATSFRFPADLALVRGVVPVGARASDDTGISKVVLQAGSRIVATDTTAPYAFSWNSTGHRGDVFLTLHAYDRAGRVTTSRQTVRVDNVAPSVLIASAPVNGRKAIRGIAYVTARATDASGINRLELVVNGKVVQRYAGPAHRFAVNTASFGKMLTVAVRGYDKAGNARLTPARTWYR